ncbi:hypothetical protein Ana3638_01920 [Anaerocolumna sedimenticola]|uniref:Uncharacterized protein n=1 Tax=Anaerocolumna sedimenticola TaxID=2696063 RepID=A0A6P1TEX6_9FIRM|nr:hypothetical protein [Anaerocolumna sedimenticola]QHQ59704.1 hypothetical protein Ana3638_01920 [Anaerocolumna sedimenticola]
MSDDFLNNQNNPYNPDTQSDQISQTDSGYDGSVNSTSSLNQSNTGDLNQNGTSDLTEKSTSTESQNNTSAPYSFWAEQIAASNLNQSGSADQKEQFSYSYNNNEQSHVFDMPDENINKNKTKKPNVFKKAVKFVLGAAVFGVVAGASFIGFNLAYYGMNPNAAPISIRVDGDKGAFGGFQLNLSDSEHKK